MAAVINQAMLLAAGFGTRMRPLTDSTPKPLLPVNGRSMLDRALDKLIAAGVTRVAINAHYLGEQIHAFAERRRADVAELVVFDEADILDTGGGVKNALPFFGNTPFYCINTDLVWSDGPIEPALQRLATAWDGAAMDALMMLVPVETAVGLYGKGDFDIAGGAALGPLVNPNWEKDSPKPQRDYFWMAAQVLHPRAYLGMPDGAFSNVAVWKQAMAQGRLWGQAHDGRGYHAGTPEDLALVDSLIAAAEQ